MKRAFCADADRNGWTLSAAADGVDAGGGAEADAFADVVDKGAAAAGGFVVGDAEAVGRADAAGFGDRFVGAEGGADGFGGGAGAVWVAEEGGGLREMLAVGAAVEGDAIGAVVGNHQLLNAGDASLFVGVEGRLRGLGDRLGSKGD